MQKQLKIIWLCAKICLKHFVKASTDRQRGEETALHSDQQLIKRYATLSRYFKKKLRPCRAMSSLRPAFKQRRPAFRSKHCSAMLIMLQPDLLMLPTKDAKDNRKGFVQSSTEDE